MSLTLGTGLAIYAAVEAGKIDSDSLLGRFLGPTVDYMGNSLANGVDKSVKNISRIFEYALDIFVSKPDNGGMVNLRVLKHIINEGAFCEDELTRAYFGGVLASSRNGDLVDDRGLNFVSLLESMSSYQIRTHYIFYTALRNKCKGMDIDFEDKDWIRKTNIFIPYEDFLTSMNLELPDRSKRDLSLPHIFWGLQRLELISSFSYTNVNVVRGYYPEADGPGFTLSPTLFGIELYMWVNGHSDIPPFHFVDKDIEFVHSNLLDIPRAEVFSL